jgi:predicted O-methyltransferase YrrM
MNFAEYRTARLAELAREPRWHGDGDNPHNVIGGLLDLIQAAKPASVLEIGCNRGISTETFLLHCGRVIAIDPWPHQQYFIEFIERCGSYPQLKVIRGFSPQVFDGFDDEVDLAYIDAAHDYDSVKADLAAALGLVRRGGHLSGHDYNLPGVARAVDEYCGPRKLPVRVFSDTSWLVECV